MNILLLAPHPFYRERGTPIAVNLLLQTLSGLGHHVDVLTFPMGIDVNYPGVTLHRVPYLPFIRDVPPGFSIGKLFYDLLMLKAALRLTAAKQYDLVHAVEEAAFIALCLKKKRGIPYVFDMDSSMPVQLLEKYPISRPLAPIMRRCEAAAVRPAAAVVAVCDALADLAHEHGARQVFILRDIALVDSTATIEAALREKARQELGLTGFCFMYIGNLEPYQGIDLLLAAFAHLIHQSQPAAILAIVGGAERDITRYRRMATQLNITSQVIFTGPLPVSRMRELFQAADALVSPRTQGANTPMKIYSYLAAGRPVLATELPTHTQVLDSQIALLTAPRPDAMADAMRILINDPDGGRRLSERARQVAETRHSAAAFQRTVAEIYQSLSDTYARTNHS